MKQNRKLLLLIPVGILAVVLCVLALRPSAPHAPDPYELVYEPLEEVSITSDQSEYPPDISYIHLSIRSDCDYLLGYPAMPLLQMWDDGNWYPVEIRFKDGEWAVSMVLHTLNAHTTDAIDFYIDSYKHPLALGHYRLLFIFQETIFPYSHKQTAFEFDVV